MSAYSTLKITRSEARRQALATVLTAEDSVLADIMDAVLRERLYNCRIVDDGAENDDAEAFP